MSLTYEDERQVGRLKCDRKLGILSPQTSLMVCVWRGLNNEIEPIKRKLNPEKEVIKELIVIRSK